MLSKNDTPSRILDNTTFQKNFQSPISSADLLPPMFSPPPQILARTPYGCTLHPTTPGILPTPNPRAGRITCRFQALGLSASAATSYPANAGYMGVVPPVGSSETGQSLCEI